MPDSKTIAFITRVHPRRKTMLRRCVESVQFQTCKDFEHIFIEDTTEKGWGKLEANKSFYKLRDTYEINSRFVMVLDDDDMLANDRFVEDFKQITEDKNFDMIIMRGYVGRFGILPSDKFWSRFITYGGIGSFCVAVSKELFYKYRGCFGNRESGGDFEYMQACYKNAKTIFWWDRLVAKTQRISGGKGENEK